MSSKASILWLAGPPVAVFVSALVYYAKFDTARTWVDARVPWVAENIGKHLPPLAINEQTADAEEAPVLSPADATSAAVAQPPAVAQPVFLTADGAVRLDLLAANKTAWPKKIALRKAMEFPAVVAGKTVGKVTAPAGSVTHMVAIQGNKLGLEYRGGGAWAEVSETDLAEQLRAGAR